MAGRLQAELLKSMVVKNNGLDMDVTVLDSTDSTNNWSLQQCREGRAMPFSCFAEEQTSGRGRRGKQWLMVGGANIAMSVAWTFDLQPQQLQLLPLSIALAIVDTLEELNLKNVQIKWPNDVYVRDKKIAGILIDAISVRKKSHQFEAETSHVGRGKIAMVIGVGLNYDMSLISAALEQSGDQIMPELTDVSNEMEGQSIEKSVERGEVASSLLRNIIKVCQCFQYEHNGYLERFRDQYDYCKNKNIKVTMENKAIMSGVALGVNNNAELLVMIDGKQHVFNSAEVSVKV